MPLLPLAGHVQARAQVSRSITENRLPQLILLTGPKGVGKQRFALWIAQAVLCEGTGSRPCGTCQPCMSVQGLAHPDLHWVMPVPRPKAPEPEKQIEELGEAIASVIAERREAPLYQAPDGLSGHFAATARLLLRKASMTPAMGRKKVFLVAEADRLVPQESSPEAANALLKLLEEPPADCQFLLTVVDANRLLPTIRSRLVPLRLGRLADAEVEQFLSTHGGLSGAGLRQRVVAAEGSIGRALALGEEDAKAIRAAEELLKVATAAPGARAERALKQGPWAARGDFTAMLDAMAALLGDAARSASGVSPKRPLPEGLASGRGVASFMAAQRKVAEARDAAQGNVNPQLLLAVLADDLAEVL